MKTLADMIHDARMKRGMTQAELGAAIGIPDSAAAQVTISRYESGSTRPQDNLGKLVRVLKLPKAKIVKLMLQETASAI